MNILHTHTRKHKSINIGCHRNSIHSFIRYLHIYDDDDDPDNHGDDYIT